MTASQSGERTNIILIGMPAAGKTYWGKKLSAHYHRPFTDLDDLIEQGEGLSVPEIFAAKEENAFRELETKYLQRLLEHKTGGMILACGGGTPCFNDNISSLKALGTVVYLRCAISTLVEHINNDYKKRPLVEKQTDTRSYLEDLLSRRSVFYERADVILQTEDISLVTFDKIIPHV